LNAAKKIILLLWLVIVASLGNASALTPGASENRVWQKSFETLETRQAEPTQTAGRHQENGVAGYDYAVDCLLAADTGALRFSQTTASPWFSSEGTFAGQTISDVAGQLRAGTLSASDVPVQVVTMDGNTLIVNTRSSLALTQGGIPQSSWNLIDMTGNADVMNSIGARLGNNGLSSAGTSTLRITGSGSGASTYFGSGTIPPPP
jgi:hypothetical protein